MFDDDFNGPLWIVVGLTAIAVALYLAPWMTLGAFLGAAALTGFWLWRIY